MKRTLSILALLHCVLALHAQDAEYNINPQDIEPKFNEPRWVTVPYSDIPNGADMIVRMSTEEVMTAFWAKHSDRYEETKSHLELQEERAIRSGAVYFRRLLMYLTDMRERSDHGYCGAYVAVWFTPAGAIENFYFSERMCPV